MAEVSTGNGLTEIELQAMRMTGDLYNLLVKIASEHDTETGQTPHTSVRDADCSELAIKIHAIQHTIMGQAAARVHPGEIRLLGHMLLEKRRT